MNIDNKLALITGGASGMGFACAKYLSELGARVVLLDLNKALLEQRAAEVSGHGFCCDVTQARDVEQVMAQVVSELGAIHIGINCAGIAPAKRVVGKDGQAMPLEDFQKVIDVNLIGTFNVLRVLSEQMAKQAALDEHGERGVIINTASVAAYEGQIGQAAYSASKGAIVSMTLPLARELERHGIRVMTIAPGIMSTPMMSAMPEKVQAALAQTVTFPKRLGEASEYARLAAHIIENEYLNGAVIRLDGGIRMAAR